MILLLVLLNRWCVILLSYFYSTLQGSIFYGISGVIERITPFGTRGSLFCTLLVAAGFTALEGKKLKNTKISVIWESDGRLDCYFLFVCLFLWSFWHTGSLFCTLLVASGFTALEGKKEKNMKISVIW